jgi:hypothetical protein
LSIVVTLLGGAIGTPSESPSTIEQEPMAAVAVAQAGVAAAAIGVHSAAVNGVVGHVVV